MFANITAKKNADGSITVQFGGCDGKVANCPLIIVRSHACLYPDRGHIRKPRHNSGARYLLAQHDPSSCIEVNQVQ
jgi:hypothetical protein